MASIKPAQGKVSIVDRASSPLKNVAKSFVGLGNASKKASSNVNKSQSSLTRLSKKLNRVNRSINAGKKSLKGYASGFGKLAGIGSFILGGGLAMAVNQQAEALDKLGKKAGNLKLPTDELQAMHEQAKHAGLSTDDMDASLTRFTKRLGVFQSTGSGLMANVIKKISPALAMQLKGAKSNKEAYEMILKTYAKLPTQQAKMALADAAFGMTGRKSLLMLDEGVNGLIASRKRLKELGGGASKEDIKAAAAYNDTMQDLSFAVNSIKFKALTPVLKEVTGLMSDFTEKFKNAKYRDEAITKVKVAVAGVFNAIKGGIGLLSSLQNHIGDVVAGVALFKIGMFALNAAMYANPIGLIVAGVAAVATGLVWAYNKFDWLRNAVDAFGSGALKVFKAIGDGFNCYFGIIGKQIDWVVSKFAKLMKFADKLSNMSFSGALDKVKDIGGGLVEKFSGYFSSGETKQIANPSTALHNIQNNNKTVVPVAVHVNVADGKVRSVETAGSTRTDVFLNNGSQF